MSDWFYSLFNVKSIAEFFIDLAISVLILIIFYHLPDVIREKASAFVKEKLKFKDVLLENAFVDSILKYVAIFAKLSGVYFAIENLPFASDKSIYIHAFMLKLLRVCVIMCIALIARNTVENSPHIFKKYFKSQELVSDTISAFLAKLIKLVIIASALVIIIKEFGYDINGLITGLGLSGLTLALAAQDTAQNFVSGIVILSDRPFAIGDWVSIDGVEGVVEDIGFRSCRIRTFSDSLVTMPNSTISASHIINWSKMSHRRVDSNFKLESSTSVEVVQKIVNSVYQKISDLDGTIKDSVLIRLGGFENSAIIVDVTYKTDKISFEEFSLFKEQVAYIILNTVEENGTALAHDVITVTDN